MKRALIYFVLAIGLLYAIRALEYVGVRKTENGEFAKLRTTFLEENNFDLLIIGSSRAECQFYTPIIDSVTGFNCYNIGMTGATMPFIRTTLEAYLVNNQPPKYVVLNLDIHSLGDNNDTVYHFARYFPFLENEVLYEGLQSRDERFTYFKWVPLYSMPYFNNRYLSNSLHGWLGTPTQYDADYEKGFAPSYRELNIGDLDTASLIETNASIPEEVKKQFQAIVGLCSQYYVKLIVVVSPLYHRQEQHVKNYQQSLDYFTESSKARAFTMINLGNDSLRYQKEMYTDAAHLTKEGARIFTRHFCSVLVQYLHK